MVWIGRRPPAQATTAAATASRRQAVQALRLTVSVASWKKVISTVRQIA
jgi:hypothetical protein